MVTKKAIAILAWGVVLSFLMVSGLVPSPDLVGEGVEPLAGVAFAQPANLYTFSGDVDVGRVSNLSVSSGLHYIGCRGDTVYVIRDNGLILCHKSTDAGQTFGPAVLVASGTNPSMKVDTAGIIYVAYQSYDADIYFSKSTNGGQSFIPAVKVNDDSIPQTGQEWPAIAVNNKGQIFIAWRDQRTAPGEPHKAVFEAASYDGGLTFTPNVQVNDSTAPMGGGIDIGADESCNVYVAWDPYSGPLFVSRSDDSGRTFSTRTPVSDGVLYPSLAIGRGFIGVAWEDVRIIDGNLRQTLRFSVSYDFGQTFSPSVIIDDSGYRDPSLVLKNDIFYVAWQATRRNPSGDIVNHIYFSYSRDTGKTFVRSVDAVSIDPNQAQHINPSLTVNEGEKAFVVWADDRYDPQFNSVWDLFAAVGKPPITKGDLNFDGFITFKDIGLELNAVFLGQPFPAPYHRADGNCDGLVGPSDMVLLLLRWYLGIPFPCD